MKQKKGPKGVSTYPFQFFEKRTTKPKFESAYSNKLQTAVSGTKHTVTTAENKILHRQHISKPTSEFAQEQNSRRMGLRGPDGRFIKSPRLTREAKSDSDSEKSNPATPQMDTIQITEGTQSRSNPTTPTTKTSGSFGRGRPKLVRNRQSPCSLTGSTDSLGPLTIITENMTDTDIDRIIEDAKQNDTELFIKDLNGKVTYNYNNTVYGGEENEEKNNLETETSDLELISNLSSSTEIEQETKQHNLRRSKRLTKTNPIIRFNNPITSDYRKHR